MGLFFFFFFFDGCEYTYDNNVLVNSGLSLRVFPWSSIGGLMSYTARRQDTNEYNELSLRCLPGHMLGGKELISVYVVGR